MTRQLHLNMFLSGLGHHEAAWRLAESDPLSDLDGEHYKHQARVAERGKLDSLFLADTPALGGDIGRRPSTALEPTVLMAALVSATKRIGLIATASTTYNDPYNLARRIASLDHISGGRAGWNVVTTQSVDAARNFGTAPLPRHRDRYARAEEFMEVSKKLWDSWPDGTIIGDKAKGIWGDHGRLRPPEHDGKYFSVGGGLNVPRSPQGYPFLVQAGSSEDGRNFAARHADAVFTVQYTLEEGRAFYAEMKARAARFGRRGADVRILPGIVPVVGATQAEAEALNAELERLIMPEFTRNQLARLFKLPADALDLDRELPESIATESQVEGGKGRFRVIVNMARRDRLTVRQLIARLAGGRGHHTVVGSPVRVADAMQRWFEEGAADGFNVMPPVLPSGVESFVDLVVPILQERGLFRTEYHGLTLRDHYGLPRPPSQYESPV